MADNSSVKVLRAVRNRDSGFLLGGHDYAHKSKSVGGGDARGGSHRGRITVCPQIGGGQFRRADSGMQHGQSLSALNRTRVTGE